MELKEHQKEVIEKIKNSKEPIGLNFEIKNNEETLKKKIKHRDER